MRPMRSLAAVSMLVWIVTAAAAGGAPVRQYLSDVLKKPAYRRAWDGMLKGQSVDAWLANYSRTRNGVTSPRGTVSIGGVTYQTGWVCKAHECGGNQFAVLFGPRGRKAWGLLDKEGSPRQYFGNPNRELRTALQNVLKG